MHCVYQLSPNNVFIRWYLIAFNDQSLLWAKTCNKQQENERYIKILNIFIDHICYVLTQLRKNTDADKLKVIKKYFLLIAK